MDVKCLDLSQNVNKKIQLYSLHLRGLGQWLLHKLLLQQLFVHEVVFLELLGHFYKEKNIQNIPYLMFRTERFKHSV